MSLVELCRGQETENYQSKTVEIATLESKNIMIAARFGKMRRGLMKVTDSMRKIDSLCLSDSSANVSEISWSETFRTLPSQRHVIFTRVTTQMMTWDKNNCYQAYTWSLQKCTNSNHDDTQSDHYLYVHKEMWVSSQSSGDLKRVLKEAAAASFPSPTNSMLKWVIRSKARRKFPAYLSFVSAIALTISVTNTRQWPQFSSPGCALVEYAAGYAFQSMSVSKLLPDPIRGANQLICWRRKGPGGIFVRRWKGRY